MLKRIIEQINYDKYFQLLQGATPRLLAFSIYDIHGNYIWSNGHTDSEAKEETRVFVREHPIMAGKMDEAPTRQKLETGESLLSYGLHDVAENSRLNLMVISKSTDEWSDRDVSSISEAMYAIKECIQNEIHLNSELDAITDELVERYEELNLVYETDNQDVKSYHGQESLRQLVKNCTDFLDVGMAALLLPEKDITIYDFSRTDPILSPSKLLTSLKENLYAWLQECKESVVINDVKSAASYGVTFDIPQKLLVSPVESGEQHVIGMLVIINHNWKPDFTNSDRNLLDVMSKKVTKVVQANFDTLTGLENSHSFEWGLREALAQARGRGLCHTLLHIDLDRTSVVNDISGREAGDALIRLVGQKISNMVRKRDIVARLGGDEFGVLLNGCPLENATVLVQNISREISAIEFKWEDKQHDISACMGVAPIFEESESVAVLMSSIEVACNAAKERGRNRVQVYQQNDLDLQRRRDEIQWVGRVQAALRENHYQLFGQLIQSLDPANEHYHFEILLRLLDEKGELVSPGAFMPAAEHYQLMPGIDRWVIRQTIDELLGANWNFQEFPFETSINLSGQSLCEEGFDAFVGAQLSRLGEAKQFICFEITESAAIANLAEASRFISAVRQMGCKFSLDDFGTGLSSFAYLKNLAVDYLKIDGCFVRNIETDPISETIVSAINQVGHAMGLKTIAEYVENEAICQRLKEMGVDYGQGYGLGRPKPFQHCLRECVSTRKTSSS